MNKVILMGRLTREPEIRYSQGERQMAIARYTLAIDRKGRNSSTGQQEADFINCTAFDRAAEFAEQYLHQGTKVLVIGRIQTGKYTNRVGQKVYTTDVIVEEQEFAESRTNAADRQREITTSSALPDYSEGFLDVPESDEDLPFN